MTITDNEAFGAQKRELPRVSPHTAQFCEQFNEKPLSARHRFDEATIAFDEAGAAAITAATIVAMQEGAIARGAGVQELLELARREKQRLEARWRKAEEEVKAAVVEFSKQQKRVTLMSSSVETRFYATVSINRFPSGKSTADLECPICDVVTQARLWSLAGSGKRCDGCGAVFSGLPDTPYAIATRKGV